MVFWLWTVFLRSWDLTLEGWCLKTPFEFERSELERNEWPAISIEIHFSPLFMSKGTLILPMRVRNAGIPPLSIIINGPPPIAMLASCYSSPPARPKTQKASIPNFPRGVGVSSIKSHIVWNKIGTRKQPFIIHSLSPNLDLSVWPSPVCARVPSRYYGRARPNNSDGLAHACRFPHARTFRQLD